MESQWFKIETKKKKEMQSKGGKKIFLIFLLNCTDYLTISERSIGAQMDS